MGLPGGPRIHANRVDARPALQYMYDVTMTTPYARRSKMRTGSCLTLLRTCRTVFWMAIVSLSPAAQARVTVGQVDHRVVLENRHVSFAYDLSRGQYTTTDKRDGSVCIKDGIFQIHDVTSSLPTLEHTWQGRDVLDELGHGKSITIKSTAPGQCSLLFEVALYDHRTCLVFAGGIENVTDQPVQLRLIKPLAAGKLFHGFDMARNFRLLDGNGGGEPLEWGVKKYTAVNQGNYTFSRNNILMTFGENKTRRSIVMGGLTYHEFEKFACIYQPRRLELTSGPDGVESLASYLNLPKDKEDTAPTGETLRLAQGDAARNFSYKALWGEEIASASLGQDGVIIEAAGLEKDTQYTLGFSWWHTDKQDRIQSVTVDGGEGTEGHVLIKDQTVPMWHNKAKTDPQQIELTIPEKVYVSGKLRILFTGEADGPPAVVNEVWLRRGSSRLLPGHFTAFNETPRARHSITGQLYAEDPVGKRVDPGIRYLPDDRFYVDFVTDNPFHNLEQYGLGIKLAQKVRLNIYDFPTVCLWYANHGGYGGGKATNDTVGAVAEMDEIVKSGFLQFSRAAVRLVPDCYSKNNQQGWWDDEHFQKYGSTNLGDFKGGTYKAPYETSEKWGKAITERGGIPLTYGQTGFRSEDYAHQFPEHMLFNHSTAWMHPSYERPLDDEEFWGNAWLKSFRVWSYDYTDPGFVAHVKQGYAAYRSGGIKGLMFDYPARGWASGGGMEDKYATTARAYRDIFRLAREGLGEDCYLHERNMERGSDITLGLVASQRTENDTDRVSPQVITRCGLRWYKNRVVVNYDTDSKNIYRLRDNRDAVRSLLTMAYVTTGRLLLANSFTQLSPEIIHDLTRIYPFHHTPQSHRPVDAFTQTYPRVYDFEVSPSWHQLIFFNTQDEAAMSIDVTLAGSTAEGTLGLNPDEDYYAYDFWNDRFVGRISGDAKLSQQLRPGEVRMMSIHQVSACPQFISTNRHIMQGYLDLSGTAWLPETKCLKGTSQVVANDAYVVTMAANGYVPQHAKANDPGVTLAMEEAGNGLVKLTIKAKENTSAAWRVYFKDPG